jgi:hypothetical protein
MNQSMNHTNHILYCVGVFLFPRPVWSYMYATPLQLYLAAPHHPYHV